MKRPLITALVLSTVLASSLSLSASAAPTSKQLLKDETGHIHNVIGKLGQTRAETAEKRALEALNFAKSDFGFDKAENHFAVKLARQDEKGIEHIKLDETLNGIPVFGHEMIVHNDHGTITGITGDYANLTANTTKASLDTQTALSKALAYTGYTGQLTTPATESLVYYAHDDQATLAYHVNLSYTADKNPANWSLLVDATNGTILSALNELALDNSAVATGTGVLGDKKNLNVYYYTAYGKYYLEDHTKPMTGDIETYSYQNGTSSMYDIVVPSTLTVTDHAATDAHYFAGLIYDYWKTNWDRNSYDNNGSAMHSVAHYSINYNNVFWDGSKLVCGDGDGVTFRSLCGALDVVAHEWMHAVIQYTANLTYSNQTGALNESIADAFGATMDKGDWMIGEDVYTPGTSGDALRYMDNPALGGQPANMSSYVNTTSDNGGVHTNSGIPNKAFYNFATAIGSRDIAMKVWYIALRDYMTSSTNFSGARAATLQACAALYGSGSSYYTALQAAWSNVGIN